MRYVLLLFFIININFCFSNSYDLNNDNFINIIKLYQNYIGEIRGFSCPMFPSCSQYSYEAYKKYDLMTATAKSIDRLSRCGHDFENYDIFQTNNKYLLIDDLDNIDAFNSKTLDILIFFTGKTETNQTPDFGNIDDLFNFAYNLQKDGDYDEAIIEYKRLLYFFQDFKYQDEIIILIQYCYYKMNRYEKSVEWYNANYLKIKDTKKKENAILLLAMCNIKLKNYDNCRNELTKLSETQDIDIITKSHILLGYSYANEYDWQKAINQFSLISDNSIYSNEVSSYKELSIEGKNLQMKSPVLAGLLSIIPGFGYIYDGYFQTGLSAFIFNSLMIGATYYCFANNNIPLGVVVGGAGLTWYLGNIYGSYTGAEKVNKKMQNDILIQFNINLY